MKRSGPLRRFTPLRSRTRLRPLGKKGRKDRDELREARVILLARSGGYCEAMFSRYCTSVGTDAHHIVRRSQGGTNDVTNLAWVCRACHTHIHDYPQSARQTGLLAGVSR